MLSSGPRFLSVFSGAGGLDLGLEAAGFKCIASIEIDPLARQVLKKNRPSWIHVGNGNVCEEAERITPRDLCLKSGELELLAGAPPCQPFSTAAQWTRAGKRGMQDPRASTLEAFLRLIEKFEPKLFIIENVPGFVSPQSGALKFLELRIKKLNERLESKYTLSHKIVDSVDYGVPQRRKRAIVIGSRIGEYGWPEPESGPMRTAWDALHDVHPLETPVAGGKWADLLPTIPEGSNYQWHTSIGGGAEIFGHRTKFWSFLLKLAKDKPAWTISAQPGPGTGPFHWDNRPLSPLEAMRLQTFPKQWKLVGSTREQIRLIGNATPPLLAEKLGRQLRFLIDGVRVTGRHKFEIPLAKVAPVPTKISAIPSRFLALVGPKRAHPGSGKGPMPRE